MNPTRNWMTALLGTSILVASTVLGGSTPTDMDMLREEIRGNKKVVVATNLGMTEVEDKQFWPVYHRYEKELNALQDRLVKVVVSYAGKRDSLSDDDARKLVEEYLSEEVDRAKMRADYFAAFSKVLPPRKVARFYQIENKIDAAMRYELAAEIPLVRR